jgi:hypothetical protein
MRNVSEINVPSAKNSFLSNLKETTKEVDNNTINNINNSEMNICKNNTNESLKLSLKSENNNKNKEKDDNKKYTKSSTYNEHNNKSNNSFNNCILNDNDIINNNLFQLKKSRTCKENEVFQRQSFNLGFNNINRNHLETVLETISEVSNSKVDSSDINKKKEETENNGKHETKETGKNKEE